MILLLKDTVAPKNFHWTFHALPHLNKQYHEH